MYALQIKEAIILAREKGLNIPIVYNSGGYENVDVLKELEGYIAIYLPDLKYINDEYAKKYSNAPNYFKYATEAILEMRRQVKDNIDENGIMKSGLVIRHMILPNMVENTKGVLKWIKENTADAVSAVNSALAEGVTPSLNANTINATVVDNCKIFYQSAQDAKQSVKDYIDKIIAVKEQSAKAISDDFFA